MPTHLDIAVIHDTRRAWPTALCDALRGEEPAQNVRIVTDGTARGPWRGMVAALATAPSDAQAVLLLEDDAVPCGGFLAAVRAAASARPLDALYFFATKRQTGEAMDAADAAVSSWCLADRPVAALAVWMPAPMARRFLMWGCDPWHDREFRAEHPLDAEAGDLRLWRWQMRVCGLRPVVSAWSLAAHGAPAPHQSLAKPRESHEGVRAAYRPVAGLAGEWPDGYAPPDAAAIDWSRGAGIDARS